ncbi:MAG: DNA glycosylase [Fimbriimonadales bacterium]
MRVNLSVPAGELDIPLCVSSGQVFRWSQVGDDWLGIAGDQMLIVTPRGNRWTLQGTNQPIPLFQYLFRMEVDLKQVQAQLMRCDPRWERWIRALPGLRLMRWNDAEECLFSFLCTPANNIPRITGMIERLCERYGEPIGEWNGTVWRRFPSAATLARVEESELRQIGFGYRAKNLIETARALQERGANWLNDLKTLPYWEAKQALMSLPGVGAKIADCVLLFGIDQPLAVPIDTHMWQAVVEWLMPELTPKSLTERTYRQIVDWFHEQFGEWTGWAHQYLFTAHLLGSKG